MVITRGKRMKKVGAKSEKETWLYCTLQPFARRCFDAIFLQLLIANESKAFFCKTFMRT